MLFTPLHRYLGEQAGPLTEKMVDDAINRGVEEADDLDWKTKLPAHKDLMRSDIVKDIAAMANSGGGMLVYGVDEDERAATRRVHAGDVDEGYERTVRRVAYTAITPPVTGLSIHVLGPEDRRVVAVVVPDSADAPHLVFRNQDFSAPLRNHSDTEWMREREIEAAYRARFTALADATAVADETYDEYRRAFSATDTAVIIAVAQPRHAQPVLERQRGELADFVTDAWNLTRHWTAGTVAQVLDNVDGYNPRVGFRRWILPWRGGDETTHCHVAVHNDGGVSMAWRIGAQQKDLETFSAPNEVASLDIEVFVANFLALVRSVSDSGDILIQLGIEWEQEGAVFCFDIDHNGKRISRSGVFGFQYSRVRAVVDVGASDDDYYRQVRAFAEDCVAQFGIRGLTHLMQPPLPPRTA